MTEHVHEWTPIDTNFGEIEEAEWFICEHCPAILSREEVISRINEYETLKRELKNVKREMRQEQTISYNWKDRAKKAEALLTAEEHEAEYPEHVCGRQGYGLHGSDSCPACDALLIAEEQDDE